MAETGGGVGVALDGGVGFMALLTEISVVQTFWGWEGGLVVLASAMARFSASGA